MPLGDSGLVEGPGSIYWEGTSEVQGIAGFPKVVVSADGRGVVSHVGARLLADVAQATGLVAGFDEVARTRRVRRSAHLPGQVLAEVAVMIADGGEAIADLAVLRNQPGLFGLVASPATCWRVLDAVDADMLAALKQARAAARERAWLLRGEAGRELPTVICGGRAQPGLVIDIDATLVTCHSEKEGTAATYKHGFGYHPMLAWLDNTGEALAGMLRSGNATANDAADHATVIETHWRRSPTATGTGRRSWSAPTAPAAPEASSAISAACVTSADWTCRSRSVSASPTPSPMRSGCCRRRPGRSRSTPTGHHGRSTTPGCRSLRSPNSPACLAIP